MQNSSEKSAERGLVDPSIVNRLIKQRICRSMDVDQSDALRSLHPAVEGFEKAGTIDQATTKRFDLACLTPVEALTLDDGKRLRRRRGMMAIGDLVALAPVGPAAEPPAFLTG